MVHQAKSIFGAEDHHQHRNRQHNQTPNQQQQQQQQHESGQSMIAPADRQHLTISSSTLDADEIIGFGYEKWSPSATSGTGILSDTMRTQTPHFPPPPMIIIGGKTMTFPKSSIPSPSSSSTMKQAPNECANRTIRRLNRCDKWLLRATAFILSPIHLRDRTFQRYFEGNLHLPYLCIAMVAADIAISILTLSLGVGSRWDLALTYDPCHRGQIWRFFTFAFVSRRTTMAPAAGWWSHAYSIVLRQPYIVHAIPLEAFHGPARLAAISAIALPGSLTLVSLVAPRSAIYWQAIPLFYVWFFALRACVLMNPTDFYKPKIDRNRKQELALFGAYLVYLILLITDCGYSPRVTFAIATLSCAFGFALGLFFYQTDRNDFAWKKALARAAMTLAVGAIAIGALLHVTWIGNFPDSNDFGSALVSDGRNNLSMTSDRQFCQNFTANFVDNYWRQFRSPMIQWNERSARWILVTAD